jgi:hypothetical protein
MGMKVGAMEMGQVWERMSCPELPKAYTQVQWDQECRRVSCFRQLYLWHLVV